jgi:cytochrome c
MKKLFALLAASFLLAGSALAADERATPQDAEELVQTAAAYLKKHGGEKAYKEFQNRNGPFIYKDLYVMVYDMTGKCMAHGADPSRVGKDLIDARDPDGKAFVRERLEVAAAKGRGTQDYKFKNPATGKIEAKTSYFEKVGDVVVAAGAYRP